jgi:hypothetical protein
MQNSSKGHRNLSRRILQNLKGNLTKDAKFRQQNQYSTASSAVLSSILHQISFEGHAERTVKLQHACWLDTIDPGTSNLNWVKGKTHPL